jgi:type IV pilus assembly protein PilC
MNTYQYTAKDKNGHTVMGILESTSEEEVAVLLHQKDLVVVSIELAKKKIFKTTSKKIKLDDLVIFSRQLATLIGAGVPLVQALGILGEQIENKSLRSVVITLRQDIEAGKSFCDSLAKHPQVFSELFINMARAGEASGALNEVLDRLATYLEKSAALARKIRAALVYPAVLVSMAVLITAALLLKVVPIFKGIFDTFGGALPLPTRILIAISNLLSKYFLLLLGLLVALSFLFKRYIGTPKGRYNFDLKKLKIPVLGPLFHKVAIVKFSRTLSTLVRSGVPILNALEIVGKASGNKALEEAVMDCHKAVREGEAISQYLSKSRVFPPIVYRMIGVGEQTGQLENMLSKVADFYDEQVDAAVSGLTSMLEPIVIVFLGVVIGGIVISLFLPIFRITELIAK